MALMEFFTKSNPTSSSWASTAVEKRQEMQIKKKYSIKKKSFCGRRHIELLTSSFFGESPPKIVTNL